MTLRLVSLTPNKLFLGSTEVTRAYLGATEVFGGFSPALLFAGGEQGAWYEPSDLTTLFQDTAGAVPVTAPGQAVARINDKSGNGHNATQATVAARPIYGIRPATGVRNLATGFASFDNPTYWPGPIPARGVVSEIIETGVEDGEDFVVLRFTGVSTFSNNGFGYWSAFSQTPCVAGDQFHGSVRLQVIAGDPAPVLAARVQMLQRATIVAANSPTVKSTTETPTETTLTCTATGTAEAGLNIVWQTGVPIDVTYKVRGLMFERGTARTAYQSNFGPYEITEPGVPSVPYLFDDGVDDELLAAIPDLGTDATLASAAGGSTTILTGQTIGAGSFDVLRGAETNAVVVVDRALTAPQTTNLTQYLDNARGA